MRRSVTAAIIIAIAISFASALCAHAADRTPPGSFLDNRATTVSELLSAVNNDPVVRARYAKHFGTTPDKVSNYLSNDLKLVSLKSPRKLLTWYVSKTGALRSKVKLFPKGSLIFADRNGQPLLMWSCGNPVRASLPVQKPIVAQTPVIEQPLQVAAVEPETKVLANPVEVITTAAVAAPPAPAVIAAEPIGAAPAIAAVAAAPVAIPPVIAGSKMALGWLGLLPLAAVGGGDDDPKPPVPEPGSLVALGSMLLGLSTVIKLRRG